MLMRVANLSAPWSRVIIVAVACLAGAIFALTSLTIPLENRLAEMHAHYFQKPVSGKTVIVQIDARSINAIQSWPWPRGIHGRLVDRLREAGAREIVFDVNFTTPAADPHQDQLFAAALKRAHGLAVLPGSLENPDGQNGVKTEMLPIPMLRQHIHIGSIWINLDEDLYARRVPYSVGIAGVQRPTLAAYLVNRPSNRRDFFPIDWSFNINSFPTISYVDVLSGRFPPNFFTGKNVLIGAAASTLGDELQAPAQGRIFGVYVHAFASETLRRHDPVPLGAWPALLITGLLIGLAMLFHRPWQRVAGFMVIIFATIGTSFALREMSPYIPEIAPALGAASVALFLSIAMEICRRVYLHVTRARGSQLPNLTAMCLAHSGAHSTIVVRLRNHGETVTLLGPEMQGELMRKIFARLAFAASNAQVYQVDEHSFAWRTDMAAKDIQAMIEGLHALFATGVTVNERLIDVTLSIGVCDDPIEDVETAVNAAIVAADQAEQRGLNWARYDAVDKDEDGDWRLSILAELDRAIEQGDIWVAYQAKYDLARRTITGAEALVRWQHPVRGAIAPDEFIPLTEESGRIEKLTMYVLDTVIRDFANIGEQMSAAVNISTRLIGHGRLLEPIRAMLQEHGMEPHRLTLEITESAAMAGDAGIAELNALRNLGIRISIDDYGTGQSTLSYLKMLPASELKIDRSFVQLITTNKSDVMVVDSTVKLAHALGLSVVAEGVESEEALVLLEKLGCDTAQGYCIARPERLDDFVRRSRRLSAARGHVAQRA